MICCNIHKEQNMQCKIRTDCCQKDHPKVMQLMDDVQQKLHLKKKTRKINLESNKNCRQKNLYQQLYFYIYIFLEDGMDECTRAKTHSNRSWSKM